MVNILLCVYIYRCVCVCVQLVGAFKGVSKGMHETENFQVSNTGTSFSPSNS